MFKKHQQTAIVLVVSILFFGIPFISAPELQNNHSFFNSLIFYKRCMETGLVVVYFYLNYFIFVPKYYHEKKYAAFILISIICLVASVKIPDLIITNEDIHNALKAQNPFGFRNKGPRPQPSFIMQLFIDKTAYQFYLALSIGILLKTSQYINGIEQDMLKSEVSYLKAQINPHFLFNTLNSLYALSLVKSDDAPNAILKLSSIMRYVVTESSNEKVLLKNEIAYITDYIDLQKLRLTSNTEIDYSVTGETDGHKIAPLLFIPIIENCFKYGVSQTEKSIIKIRIMTEGKKIVLQTQNRKVTRNISELEKTETGIVNTQKRLDILYKNNYNLEISNTEDYYSVLLKINLV